MQRVGESGTGLTALAWGKNMCRLLGVAAQCGIKFR